MEKKNGWEPWQCFLFITVNHTHPRYGKILSSLGLRAKEVFNGNYKPLIPCQKEEGGDIVVRQIKNYSTSTGIWQEWNFVSCQMDRMFGLGSGDQEYKYFKIPTPDQVFKNLKGQPVVAITATNLAFILFEKIEFSPLEMCWWEYCSSCQEECSHRRGRRKIWIEGESKSFLRCWKNNVQCKEKVINKEICLNCSFF